MSIISTDQKYIASTYKRFPVEIVKGRGSEVFDAEGKRYIDMGSGIGVTAFGIADEEWQQAVIGQIGKVQHMSNLYYTEPCAKLAEQLCLKSGMKKVFFGNSGAEANDGAIKAARKYSAEKKGSSCYTIITLINSFHGRTLTTLAATGQDHFHQLFQPLTPGFIHVPANDTEALERAVDENEIAGIMMECIQGEGGVRALDRGYVKAAAKLCSDKDIPLIIDEVQSGNGRSGRMYSYQNYDIMPDVVSTAKGLAGGLPIGAVLLGEKLQDVFSYGDHGSTFGGNPVSCAAALSVVNRIDEQLLESVRKKSAYLFDTLGKAEGITEVSGMGLMICLSTIRPAGEVLAECMRNGVLCLTAKDKLRLLPALNIPEELLREAAGIIMKACS